MFEHIIQNLYKHKQKNVKHFLQIKKKMHDILYKTTE